MKEHPILFSSEMVKALLEGRKTQTRRVIGIPKYARIKPCEHYLTPNDTHNGGVMLCYDTSGLADFKVLPCPYGQVGDVLWCRETWTVDKTWDNISPNMIEPNVAVAWKTSPPMAWVGKWRPSIFMPRWASRITLEITDIKVQRLQEISHKDALAEGVSYDVSKEGGSPLERYKSLWDKINGKNHAWNLNEWVWVIEFKRIKCE